MTKQIEDIKSARAVIWPFRKMNQPMGELLDNGRITPKDLEFAAKKAYNQDVKTAADLLLWVHYARQVVWPFRKLDKRWTIYRNLQLPDSKADLDAVLVGPPGVLVIEIKAYTGSFKVNGDRWHYRRAGRWYQNDKSPLRQALANKRRLNAYLAQNNLSEIPVDTAVILGRDPDYIHFHKPVIPVRRLRDMDKILEPYIQQPTLPGAQVVAVKWLLNKICPI
ncbi:MAG TPA: NERD domain-containing protein [Anaerolineae bacterium]|nr:NERD domain-containing protein [Anaerolineae bacterium]